LTLAYDFGQQVGEIVFEISQGVSEHLHPISEAEFGTAASAKEVTNGEKAPPKPVTLNLYESLAGNDARKVYLGSPCDEDIVQDGIPSP
jgi:hypothetical protein